MYINNAKYYIIVNIIGLKHNYDYHPTDFSKYNHNLPIKLFF